MPGKDDREWVRADEAAALLGVKRATLYAYASRALVRTLARSARERTRLYHRGDLERLRARSRARSGHGAVAAGALRWGEPVLETRVGEIRPDGPWYRGSSAVELARSGASFEHVCGILWRSEAAAAQARSHRGPSVAPLRSLAAVVPAGAEPLRAMMVAAAILAAAEPRETSVSALRASAPWLVRVLVAACGARSGTASVEASLEADGVARALLVALGGRTTPAAVSAITEGLVLTADHELNPSTFAARVVASAGGGLAAAVGAALGALSGPLHGGATGRVEELVRAARAPEHAAAVVAARLEADDGVPGFDHPLYPGGDPRAARLLEVVRRVGARGRVVRILESLVSTMDLARGSYPTLDVGLVALAAALGLGRGAALAIFACGRLAGWIAHAIEQREAGFVLRPRARYVGSSS